MSYFSCFSVFPKGGPSHCDQEDETLLWFDFSMQYTYSVFPAKSDEGTPRGIDSGCVENLEENHKVVE